MLLSWTVALRPAPRDDRAGDRLLGISTGEGRSRGERLVWTGGGYDASISSGWDRWCSPFADGGNPRDHTFRTSSRGPDQADRRQTSGLDDASDRKLSLYEPDSQSVAGKTTLASRGVLCKTPSPQVAISCLAGFLGEMIDSGCNTGLDGRRN